MKKLVKVLVLPILIIILFFCFVSCGDNDSDTNEKITLPQFLYNSKAECIAFTHGEKYLRNYETREHFATYDFDLNIFISTDGKYFGEIKYDNVLLYNTNSEYKNVNRGMQPLAPLNPTPGLAPIRGIVGILGLGWEDVSLENETTPPITPSTKYTLTLSNIGQGTVSEGGSYEAETSITITAIPNDGYYFHGWYADGSMVSTDNPYNFTMPNNDYILIASLTTTPITPPEPTAEKCTLTINLKTRTNIGGKKGEILGASGCYIWGTAKDLVIQSNDNNTISVEVAIGEQVNLVAVADNKLKFEGWYRYETGYFEFEKKPTTTNITYSFIMTDSISKIDAMFT